MDGERIRADLEQFVESAVFFDKNRKVISREFPDSIVAVFNSKVIGCAPDIHELIFRLGELGINSNSTYLGTTKPEEYHLIPSNFLTRP